MGGKNGFEPGRICISQEIQIPGTGKSRVAGNEFFIQTYFAVLQKIRKMDRRNLVFYKKINWVHSLVKRYQGHGGPGISE
jgi:hypothetical protein